MIKSFRSRGLHRFFASDNAGAIRPDLVERVRLRLSQLDAARAPEDMAVPGSRFHALHGKPKRYAVAVNGPWRITFEWDGQDAIRVDLEQYH